MELLPLCVLFGLVRSQLDFYQMPQFETCRRSSPDHNQCLKSAIQTTLAVLDKGKPLLNFPSVQPTEVPQWLVDAGRVMSFEQKYTEIKLYNHARCTVDNVEFFYTGSDLRLSFSFDNPETVFTAKYQYKDPVLMGMMLMDTGNLTFTEKGYSGNITIQGDVAEDDGLRYVYVKDVGLNREQPVSVTYKIETGDDDHDEKASKILNDNLQALYGDVGEEFKNMYQFGYHSIIDAFFSTVPFDQLFPE